MEEGGGVSPGRWAYHACESDTKHHESPHEEKHQPATFNLRIRLCCVVLETNRVVHADEEDQGSKCIPRDFHDDVSDHESFPGVGLCWPFSRFVQISLRDEVWHRLVAHEDLDNEEHEE